MKESPDPQQSCCQLFNYQNN